jgi:hypothetical protein
LIIEWLVRLGFERCFRAIHQYRFVAVLGLKDCCGPAQKLTLRFDQAVKYFHSQRELSIRSSYLRVLLFQAEEDFFQGSGFMLEYVFDKAGQRSTRFGKANFYELGHLD